MGTAGIDDSSGGNRSGPAGGVSPGESLSQQGTSDGESPGLPGHPGAGHGADAGHVFSRRLPAGPAWPGRVHRSAGATGPAQYSSASFLSHFTYNNILSTRLYPLALYIPGQGLEGASPDHLGRRSPGGGLRRCSRHVGSFGTAVLRPGADALRGGTGLVRHRQTEKRRCGPGRRSRPPGPPLFQVSQFLPASGSDCSPAGC